VTGFFWRKLMLRRLFLALIAGLALSATFAHDASAQRRDDDRYFFLRDPFGRGRSLFDFPDRAPPPKKTYVEPPSTDPAGTVYGSSAEADEQRFIGASEYVAVFGDSLAEQLSQGLADEFVAERPEVAIVKKTKINTGFVRTDVYDWAAQASSLLSKEKATALVVLLGINDRQPLRDQDGAQEFRSDRWKEIYGKRVEDFLVKLKEKNVPIFVVGLPPVRSPKMSLDAIYINEILTERTRKVGGYYIDVWDGFVAENGDFMATGPALDGQTRRLRASDGVHFTKAGQRKLAHYVERELVRLFDSRPGRAPKLPPDVSPETRAPAPPAGQVTAPNTRPLAGPVMPLTQTSGIGGELLGAPGAVASPVKITLPTTDPNLARTLVEGRPVEPVSGRADDFRWPPQTEAATPANAPVPAAAPEAGTDVPAETLRPVIATPKNQKKNAPPAR
jgi:uncharacterized protein